MGAINPRDAGGRIPASDAPSSDERLTMSDDELAAFEARREALLLAVHGLETEIGELASRSEPDVHRLAAAAGVFLGDLRRHVDEAESPGGLIAQVRDSAPWFSARADQLRDDHAALLEQAERLVRDAASGVDPGSLLDAARHLAAAASAHRHRGTGLLLDAFLLDVGAAD